MRACDLDFWWQLWFGVAFTVVIVLAVLMVVCVVGALFEMRTERES
jgi:hypothetical protein